MLDSTVVCRRALACEWGGGCGSGFRRARAEPRRAGAAKPGRPERAFGAKVRCAGPKLRRRTTIGPPTTLWDGPS